MGEDTGAHSQVIVRTGGGSLPRFHHLADRGPECLLVASLAGVEHLGGWCAPGPEGAWGIGPGLWAQCRAGTPSRAPPAPSPYRASPVPRVRFLFGGGRWLQSVRGGGGA